MIMTVGGTAVASARHGRRRQRGVAGRRALARRARLLRAVGQHDLPQRGLRPHRGREDHAATRVLYSIVQGGWPLGFLLSAALRRAAAAVLGWRGCSCSPLARDRARVHRAASSGRPRSSSCSRGAPAAGAPAQRGGRPLADGYGLGTRGPGADRADLRAGPASQHRRALARVDRELLRHPDLQRPRQLDPGNGKGVELGGAFYMLVDHQPGRHFGYVFHGWLGDQDRPKRTIVIGWLISGGRLRGDAAPGAEQPRS